MRKVVYDIFLFFSITTIWLSPIRAQQSVEDSLNKIISQSKNEADIAKAYNGLAYEYSRKDPVKSRAYLEEAITIGKKINDLRRLSSSYSQLVYLLHDTGKPDSAEYYLNVVKNLAVQANESEKDAVNSNYYVVAALYYKRTGAYQKAIPFFEKAINVFIKMGDKQSTAGQMLNLGNTYTSLGNYQKATEQHLKSLRLFEEIDNQRGISFCYQGLSNSFTQLKQYNQALVYANKSLKIKTTLNDRRGIGSAQSGLGDIYLGLGNHEKALYHYNAAINIAKELKQLPEEQTNYFNLAKVYVAKKEVKQAIDYFNLSKLVANQLRDSSAMASIDAELIVLQNNVEKTELSENKLKTTLELFQEQGDLNRQASGIKNMVDFYVANKQFDKALEHTNKYHRVIDSIRNNELQLQVLKMEEGYNSVKKEKEIELLKKDKEVERQKLFRQRILFGAAAVLLIISLLSIGLLINRTRLRQRMKELELRNQIAADLHDEVGSSLSSINMLSQMASQQDDKGSQKDILDRMRNNARETMDKMGDIVWMIKPGETEAASLKLRMERFAYEICSAKNISLSLQVDALEKIKLSMDQRKNIYLIFKEALNNAVKYSGTERIDISTAIQNRELVMQVRDEGKGFDTTLVLKGNGLDNIKNRAAELGGSLDINSVNGGGTTVKLSMPVTG